MNKQEAIEKIKDEIIANSRRSERVDFMMGVSFGLNNALNIAEQIDQPQKVVVPEFIDSFIRYAKAEDMSLFIAMDNAQNKESEWIIKNEETFARAWLDGYEVEQERLYTVEVPNPNDAQLMTVLKQLSSGKIIMCTVHRSNAHLFETEEFQLTESEIKQDFEWAWQWAEPVEVE